MFAVWLQLILSQLQLILSQLTFSVANNSGSEDSCLQVGAFMFAVRYIYAEVLDFLLHSPTKNEIIAFKVSPQAQERLRTLLEKNRESALTPLETAELDTYQQLEHLMILLKAHAVNAIN
ncbi:hypothetical protein [Gloeothece verrucosa]|uniref:Uncharacterized protein n=1 Tax=Gloeothece verrucosa (strain PCC 7822) TaxID=497965 RepID=E0UNX6_GLOV7|nr:hypothetical protein [Gloeothece verrucosa]ADN18656.1 hypothetical protein Cyan7822_6643 [Gloeothece verrucosa PCC 7822]